MKIKAHIGRNKEANICMGAGLMIEFGRPIDWLTGMTKQVWTSTSCPCDGMMFNIIFMNTNNGTLLPIEIHPIFV